MARLATSQRAPALLSISAASPTWFPFTGTGRAFARPYVGHSIVTDTNIPGPVPPAELPQHIRAEIARARTYLDGLESRMAEYDAGLWSTSHALSWAAEMDARFSENTPVVNLDGTTGHGTAAHLDRLVKALVDHVLNIGGTIARLPPSSNTKN